MLRVLYTVLALAATLAFVGAPTAQAAFPPHFSYPGDEPTEVVVDHFRLTDEGFIVTGTVDCVQGDNTGDYSVAVTVSAGQNRATAETATGTCVEPGRLPFTAVGYGRVDRWNPPGLGCVTLDVQARATVEYWTDRDNWLFASDTDNAKIEGAEGWEGHSCEYGVRTSSGWGNDAAWSDAAEVAIYHVVRWSHSARASGTLDCVRGATVGDFTIGISYLDEQASATVTGTCDANEQIEFWADFTGLPAASSNLTAAHFKAEATVTYTAGGQPVEAFDRFDSTSVEWENDFS